jgi:4'-phosphopantetheinyl transferase
LIEARRWRLFADGAECGGLVFFPLEISATERDALAPLLSDSEAARAARFLFPLHGQRYTVAHGQLRLLLAQLLEQEPKRLTFAAGAHGKPELAGNAASSGLQFNLSHSGAYGLVGWSWRRDIGVDVEAWRTMSDEEALVQRYFSAVEAAAWNELPQASRHEAFFNLWTRKEAYVKALGRGLGLPLHSFDVSHERGVDARLLRASKLAGDNRPWSLAAPVVDGAISLAVVLQSETLTVSPAG